jgi:GDP-6-deoxy-D-talose 4-dehydrogenase
LNTPTVRKALVTGAAGFTGRYLVRELLDAGYEVTGAGSAPPPDTKTEVDIRYHACDLLDKAGLARAVSDVKPDVIVHLAAIAFVAHGNVDEIYTTNVLGSRNLMEAAGKLETPPSVLIASSANIYGNSHAGRLDETMEPSPANDYAVSKLAMEYMAKVWADRLPLTIVRPFNYTGVGQSPQFVLPKIVDHFRRKASRIELGNIDVTRDFSDVRMVVNCYRRLVDAATSRSVRGQTFNICSDRGTSLNDVIAALEKISGHRLDVAVNPVFVRPNEIKHLVGSHAKLASAIGDIHPKPLADTLAWMYHAPA